MQAVLLLVATYFKTMHWPGANVLLTVGGVAGILVFVILAATFQSKLTGKLEKVSVNVAALTLIVSFLAFLFKVLHWPGAAKLIWAADIGILLSAIVLLIDGYFEQKHDKWALKIIAAFFAILLLLIIYLVS